LLLLVAFVVTLPTLGRAQEDGENQAGLIIQYGDGRVETACVRFSEPEISGLDALERSGLSYIAQTGGVGAAVCKIGGDGCDFPNEDCFCRCKGADCTYWSYQQLRDGQWAQSPLGASSSKVRPGNVEGWAWGAGSVAQGAQPPVLTLEEICVAANETPTNDEGQTTNEGLTPTTDHRPPTNEALMPTTEALAPTEDGGRTTAGATPTEDGGRTTAGATTTEDEGRTTNEGLTPTTLPVATNVVAIEDGGQRTTDNRQPTTDDQPEAAVTPDQLQRQTLPTSRATTALLPTQTVAEPAGAAVTPIPPQAESRKSAGYLIFAALTLALIGGIGFVSLRRQKTTDN
jgi:hypothetical protein